MIPLAAINQLAAVYRGRGRNEAYLETVAEKLSRFRRVMLGRDVYDLAAVTRHVEHRLPLLREVLCFKAYFDRVEENRDTLPVPFAGGAEFAQRIPADVIGADDLGLLTGDAIDVATLLRTIEGTYGRMGVPTGEAETRLANCRFDDLHWARTLYAERAAEMRQSDNTIMAFSVADAYTDSLDRP